MMALRGVRVVEMLGLAPGPFCGMLLAEFGAQVTVVQKIHPSSLDVLSNGKRAISIDLKSSEGAAVVRRLCKSSDVLLDTYRPGVLEKLGLGPDVLLQENPRLIYARLTGYGQSGPYHMKGGHDINYAALSGVLSYLSRKGEPPIPPINLLADFAGGGLMCAFGILAALLERTQSGRGQVIDASMVEGTAYLSSWLFRSTSLPIWSGEPGTNILDGGAPFYKIYKTKDNKFMAVGALEPQFYEQFLEGLGLSSDDCFQFGDMEANRRTFENAFSSKTQAEWCEIFDRLDGCVTPVLDVESAATHAHNTERNVFSKNESGETVPHPAPRLSRTPATSRACNRAPQHGEHTATVLRELGFTKTDIDKLACDGHVTVPLKASL